MLIRNNKVSAPNNALAHIIGINPTEISSVAEIYESPLFYRPLEIKPRRKGGKSRQILVPSDELKAIQRAILEKILAAVPPHHAATAFFKGRSIAQNARKHQGCSHLYKTDIRDFFQSISANRVRHALEVRLPHLTRPAIAEIVRLTTHEGVLPQGAPTSPHLANLVLYDFDQLLHQICTRVGACYTRYADDISVSAGDMEALILINEIVRSRLSELGLEQHQPKTRFYGPKSRKIVTGLDISAKTIRPPRSFRRKAAALVRMCAIYPSRMRNSAPRVAGYLSHWNGIAPDDPELIRLKKLLGQAPLNRSNEGRKTQESTNQDAEKSRGQEMGKSTVIRRLDDDIPF